MTYQNAIKWLKLNYKIRRKVWPKHVYCTQIQDLPDDKLYMIMVGMKNQLVTKTELSASDWERA